MNQSANLSPVPETNITEISGSRLKKVAVRLGWAAAALATGVTGVVVAHEAITHEDTVMTTPIQEPSGCERIEDGGSAMTPDLFCY